MMDIDLIRGPSMPKEYEVCDYTMGKCFYKCLKRHGNRTAWVHGKTNDSITFDKILKKSTVLALKLRDIGIGEGDIVSVISENSLDYLVAFIAVLYLGATVAPINPSLTYREFMHVFGLYKPRIVFCSSTTVDIMQKIKKDVDFLEKFIVFDAPNADLVDGFEEYADYVKLDGRNKEIDSFEPVTVDPENHIAVILCSSGTTGLPKGVKLTHTNMAMAINTFSVPTLGGFREDSTALLILPFFHTFGLHVALTAFVLGVKSIVFSKFEPEVFLSSIVTHVITNIPLVPPLLVFLAKSPLVEKYDLSSVRDIFFAAAPASPEIIDLVRQRLNITNVRNFYGLTETTCAVTGTPLNMFKYGSSGKLVPGTILKVVQPDSNAVLGPNQKGEICIGGSFTMKGYIEENQTATMLDDEGWIHTGDIGYYDNDGFIFIVDRLKELIKYKGFQVAPAEIEDLLLTHTEIKDCAVVGIADENAGELPLAFIVKQPKATITAEDVTRYVAENASYYKRLNGGVRFVDEIPKNPSGKILRRKLRELYLTDIII